LFDAFANSTRYHQLVACDHLPLCAIMIITS